MVVGGNRVLFDAMVLQGTFCCADIVQESTPEAQGMYGVSRAN